MLLVGIIEKVVASFFEAGHTEPASDLLLVFCVDGFFSSVGVPLMAGGNV